MNHLVSYLSAIRQVSENLTIYCIMKNLTKTIVITIISLFILIHAFISMWWMSALGMIALGIYYIAISKNKYIVAFRKIGRLENPDRFGESKEERFFNVALELCITWINRILFFKLMAAQLVNYYKDNKVYEFLNTEKIHYYDDPEYLFSRCWLCPHR
ncbi:MAG: type restriction endonuclease [Anaerophaga sp.]|nr:type restriction endonuclease [Anaerophaga sp.]MDI3521501.1 adenine-specific DNA-methyltransferase [Anaerophaga sp.]MDN5291304.1 adenine-specific DNA-methyltransferase [Anaerophaga sp.]